MESNPLGTLLSREVGSSARKDPLVWSEPTVDKMQLEVSIKGHSGCVNRLAWNQEGSLLASASDDRNVMLLHYPSDLPSEAAPYSGPITAIPTHHAANIFGVQFLPFSDSSKLVTCGMDGSVQLHDLCGGPSSHQRAQCWQSRYYRFRDALGSESESEYEYEWYKEDEDEEDLAEMIRRPLSREVLERFQRMMKEKPHPGLQNVASNVGTTVYDCHERSVKSVQVHQECPTLFWSGSEDGTVRQFDTRLPTSSMSAVDSKNVVVDLPPGSHAARVKVKSIAVNPSRSFEIAVGGNDGLARIYDMRKSGPNSCSAHDTVTNTSQGGEVCQFAPPGARLGPAAYIAVTHVAYGKHGKNLIVNHHGESVYVWNVDSVTRHGDEGPAPQCAVQLAGGAMGVAHDAQNQAQTLSPYELNLMDDDTALANRNATSLVQHYTHGIQKNPGAARVWASRARGLLARGWIGDRIEALHDAEKAVALDSKCDEAQLRRAEALRACGFPRAAAAAALIRDRHPAVDPPRKPYIDYSYVEKDRVRAAKEWKKFERKLASDLDKVCRLEGDGSEESNAARHGHTWNAGRVRARLRTQQQQQEEEENDGEYMEEDVPEEHPIHSGKESKGGSGEGGDEALEALFNSSDSERDRNESVEGYPNRLAKRIDAVLELEFIKFLNNYDVRQGASGRSRRSSHIRPGPWLWGALPGTRRLVGRYIGHRNLETDIKEAVLLGDDDQIIACGSDDGRIFFYETKTGLCLRTVKGDEGVVNNVCSHPFLPVLATSGTEPTVKIWTPEGTESPGVILRYAIEVQKCCEANHSAMQDLRRGPMME